MVRAPALEKRIELQREMDGNSVGLGNCIPRAMTTPSPSHSALSMSSITSMSSQLAAIDTSRCQLCRHSRASVASSSTGMESSSRSTESVSLVGVLAFVHVCAGALFGGVVR